MIASFFRLRVVPLAVWWALFASAAMGQTGSGSSPTLQIEPEPTRTAEEALEFVIQFPGLSQFAVPQLNQSNGRFTGRVYLFFAKGNREPRLVATNWFNPQPFVSKDVSGWLGGTPLRLHLNEPGLHHFYGQHSDEPLSQMQVQAVIRFNALDPEVPTGIGNGYSLPVAVNTLGTTRLLVDRIVPEQPYRETQWGRLLSVPSPAMSKFHHRAVRLNATVVLPASYYAETVRRYPVLFEVPGFGGDHRIDPVEAPVAEQNEAGVEFIRVLLDPKCPLGHHVFADSANNGPVGTAFVTEFLPALDAAFRTLPQPHARLLTGHSSGGWSSLWLQVTNPEVFGGVWSTAPDPVDFHDFQQIDLYAQNINMYVDTAGQPRPLARRNGQVIVRYRDFAEMEHVLGPGGQLGSFEAVFSPATAEGSPRALWNRQTGNVDSATAANWQNYDLRLLLSQNPQLVTQLQGKIHIYMGADDTFYLEGAAVRLKQALAKMQSDAVVELFPGRDHFTLLTPALKQRMRNEMVATFLKGAADKP